MSSNIILNRDNIVSTDNNHLVYKFPSTVNFTKDDKIAITSAILYYSWFNVTARNNNNFLQYKWFDINKDLVVFDIVIIDGYYTLETLFEYIMYALVARKHYLIDPNGKFIHFIELLTNSTYYSVQVKLSSIGKLMTFNGLQYDITDPSSDYRIPGNANWLPQDNGFITPELIIPSNNKFGELLGFKPGIITYDTSTDTINNQYSILGDSASNIEPQNAVIIRCNMVKNSLGKPRDIIQSFPVIKTLFGGAIQGIHEAIYSYISPGNYHEMELMFYDNNFKPLIIQDPSMTINVSIIVDRNI
jgi:hypothetical protein